MRKAALKLFFLAITFLLFIPGIYGQKTGLVLSGGGASGIAHIGVIKALEENNIPIDYITGTSIGAFVGALYAIGYTPQQMEQLVQSEKFKTLVSGQIDSKYVFYFKNKEDNASWITFKLSLDSLIEPSLPTNIISPIPMDLSLMEMLAPSAAAAGYNFDSLMIPFRCVASDIEAKKSVVFNSGSLSEAVRASLTYPFYLKPININGKLLFDGGLYNNFPSNVMYEDFYPDFIIGSNVTGNAPPPKEDDIMSQIRSMLVSKTNYNVICENGIIIEPKVDVALFDFDNTQALIDSGYSAAIRQITRIKNCYPNEREIVDIAKKRNDFISKQPKLLFDEVKVRGLNESQTSYVKKTLFPKGKQVGIDKLRDDYYKLAADERIKSIFPDAVKKPNGLYTLNLNIKKEKDLLTYFGGNFSNRPISTGFVGFKYNYLGKIATTIAGNTYFGKLYTSAQIKARFDFPFRVPFFIEPNLTYNRWDFFKSRYVFFEDVKPAYLIQREEFGEIYIGIPAKNKGKFMLGTGYVNNVNSYYQTEIYAEADTADRTSFSFANTSFSYEYNNLNRKQYASEGTYFSIKSKYVQGEEFTNPGTTAIDKKNFRAVHEWFQFRFNFESYYKRRGTLRLGVYAEMVYSTQPFFQNYTATKLVSPGFQPTPESQTLFIENYHTHKFFSTGLKNVINIRKNLELRIDGFIALPYQSIHKDVNLKPYYGDIFVTKHYIGMAGLVYHTPVGPACISINYYDKLSNPLSFMFHFGYIIFNKSAFN